MHDKASFDDASFSEGAQNVASAIFNDEANENSECLFPDDYDDSYSFLRDFESDDYYGGYSQQETQTGRYDDLSSRQRKEKA